MAIVITNALLADLDPPRVEQSELRLDGGRIVERGPTVTRGAEDEILDCAGCVVLPGLVNGHTHLYSALAVGMPPPPKTPTDFHEILKYVWWRLDQALDSELIEVSARIGALDALRCGTTTLIDHHASPDKIARSLDLVEKSVADVGLRGVLCYETTDRHGRAGREDGIEENRRYLEKCVDRRNGRFAGLVGAHASFTLEDEALDQLATVAADFDSGVHIHVAEDACDEDYCQAEHQMFLLDRLAGHGLLTPAAVFAHGTHLAADEIARVSQVGLTIAHNPRSNMNNAVGYAPVAALRCPVMLGTDGIGGDMFAEARAAWYAARHEQAPLTPNDIVAMLANAARRASQALDVTLGKLEVSAAADVVITDYRPSTPLSSENLGAHLIWGLGSGHVKDVLVGGKRLMRERVVKSRDQERDRRQAQEAAKRLWERMSQLPAD